MYKLADISQFESLANMTSTVVNNRMVVDNGIRDIWQNVTQPIRRSLGGKHTARLLREINPIPTAEMQRYVNKVTGYSRRGDSNIYRLGSNVGRITPVGRKNMEAFDIWLRSQNWNALDMGSRSDRYMARDLRRNIGQCMNFLANLNVDVSPIMYTLKLDLRANERCRYKPGDHIIVLSPNRYARGALFHEFIHALEYNNEKIRAALDNRGFIDSFVRKYMPMRIKDMFYDVFRDGPWLYLYDKRRAGKSGYAYTGKVYSNPEKNGAFSGYLTADPDMKDIRKWDSSYADILYKKQKRITPSSRSEVMRDLLSRPSISTEYLTTLPSVLRKNKGRLPAGYAKDLLRIIRLMNK